jgi:hypothetical protein
LTYLKVLLWLWPGETTENQGKPNSIWRVISEFRTEYFLNTSPEDSHCINLPCFGDTALSGPIISSVASTFVLVELVHILEDLFASLNENLHEATVLFLAMQNLGYELSCNISWF